MLTYAVYLNWQEQILLKPHRTLDRTKLVNVRMDCRKRHLHERGVLMVEIKRADLLVARAYCHCDSTTGGASYEGLANIRRVVGIERYHCAQRYRRSGEHAAARHILQGARELFAGHHPLP